MTDKLTPKQQAEKMRQAAALMEDVGRLYTAQSFRKDADALDPPSDPYAGLDDDQWVEVVIRHRISPESHICKMVVLRRLNPEDWSLVRVVPDGDARDVLVIPVEQAERAYEMDTNIYTLLESAMRKHRERWSS